MRVRSRVVYWDLIRIVAMLGVIMNHATANALAKMSYIENWNFASVMICIVTPAVPLFFMISGAAILNSPRTYNIGRIFRRRLFRIIVPYVMWSFISLVTFEFMDHQHFSWTPIWNTMMMIFHKPTFEAFWFLYPLIGFYLLSPLLKAMVDHADTKLLDYAIIIWFVTNFLLPVLSQSLPKPWPKILDVYSMGSLMFLAKSLGYFILGYRLTLIKKIRLKPIVNILLSFIVLVVMIFVNYLNYKYKNINIPIIGYAPAILTPLLASLNFLFFKQIGSTLSAKEARIVEYIAPLTYGVYLIHGIGIRIAQNFTKDLNFTLIFLIAAGFSLAVIWIVYRIPFINKPSS